jgi:hypothetical protein
VRPLRPAVERRLALVVRRTKVMDAGLRAMMAALAGEAPGKGDVPLAAAAC